jgi:hypothetical protein
MLWCQSRKRRDAQQIVEVDCSSPERHQTIAGILVGFVSGRFDLSKVQRLQKL